MSEPFIVEVWGRPAGFVLPDGDTFRFHALARPFFELDGAPFTTPGHARLAAAKLQQLGRVARPERHEGQTGAAS